MSTVISQPAAKPLADPTRIAAALVLQLLLFIIYKLVYPQPDFFPESYKYVTIAHQGLLVYVRPVGYGYFLRLLHLFAASANLVVWVQYLLLSGASLYLYTTNSKLFPQQRKVVKWMALAGLALNPIVSVLSNQIGCDALFTAVWLFWLAFLLRIFIKPNLQALLLHVIALCLLLLLRDNALHLVLLSALAFLCAVNAGQTFRLSGILVVLSCSALLITGIRRQAKEITGVAAYSAFHGWQMANNALYIYPYTNAVSVPAANAQQHLMQQLANSYFDKMSAEERQHFAAARAGSDFLWNNRAPLKQYLACYQTRANTAYDEAWFRVSVPFREFGWQMITQHPAAYIRHFMLPNARNFLYPNSESLADFNAFHEGVPEETAAYFGLPKGGAKAADPSRLQHLLTAIYRLMHVLALLVCVLTPVIYLVKIKRGSYRMPALYCLLFVVVCMVVSAATSFVLLRNETIWVAFALCVPLGLADTLISRHKKARQQ